MAILQTAVGERIAVVNVDAPLSSVGTWAWFLAYEVLKNFSELLNVGGWRQCISVGPPWTQLGRLHGPFSIYSWFRGDGEELEGSKISMGHSGQPSWHRKDTRVMSCSCAFTTCDHLESNWKEFMLNCKRLFLNGSNPSCPMGCTKGMPGSLRNLDLSGMIPVLLTRTSCLCVNSLLWVLQLVGLWN